MENKYYCYILKSNNPLYKNITYNGSTNNLKRRIRQHNEEIKGGAKATRGKGPWEFYAILEGFENKIEALCCEWRIKHPTNTRRPKQYCGVIGRIKSLNLVLSLDKWTNNSIGLENKNKIYKLYIQEEYKNIIEKDNIKNNIEIIDINNLFNLDEDKKRLVH